MAEIQLSRARFAASFDFDNRLHRNKQSFYANEGFDIVLNTDLGLIRIESDNKVVFTTLYNLVSCEPMEASNDSRAEALPEKAKEKPSKDKA